MNVLDHWGLNENPFEEVCDTRYFFQSDDHQEALDRLRYVVNDKNMNMGLLTGEVGSGKTLTKNVFMNTLPSKDFKIIDFENSNFEFVDILYEIVARIATGARRVPTNLGTDVVPSRNDKYMLVAMFKEQLENLVYEQKKHLVLLFDEAQLMQEHVLDEVKSLTNISSGTSKYLTIFLVGQPELRTKIHNLRQVDQRIFLRFHLNNLDYNNTVNYIQHRQRISGLKTGTIFNDSAFERLFRSTGGVPREISRICKLALTFGFGQGLHEISDSDIEVVLEDLERHQ